MRELAFDETEPQYEVPRGWTLRFSLIWFGFWMASLVPIQLVLPNQLNILDHQHKIRDFVLINGVTGVAALITLPLFGALSATAHARGSVAAGSGSSLARCCSPSGWCSAECSVNGWHSVLRGYSRRSASTWRPTPSPRPPPTRCQITNVA